MLKQDTLLSSGQTLDNYLHNQNICSRLHMVCVQSELNELVINIHILHLTNQNELVTLIMFILLYIKGTVFIIINYY